MDSITQATLGAVVADAVLGSRLGNRAVLWGLALGTLPDLDVLVNPWLDNVQRLYWHRGLSHSLLGLVIATPLCAWLLRRVHGPVVTKTRAMAAVALVLGTHVLIDLFNLYGTQILEPFSNRRLSIGNMAIIDPLFTLPLLGATLIVVWVRRNLILRWRISMVALLLASLYTGWSLAAKAMINRRFAAHLPDGGAQVMRWRTAPTLANTLLWRAVVEVPEGYWIGYASVLDADPAIDWQWIEARRDLLDGWQDTRAVAAARWFSEGYYVVRMLDDRPLISDARLGMHVLDDDQRLPPWPGVFHFHISQDGHDLHRVSRPVDDADATIRRGWRRMWGRR